MRKVLGILMEFLYVSPMLFTSVIAPLHWMFAKAHADGVLAPLNLPPSNLRLSLYADDAALFITPVPEDVLVTKQLFASVRRHFRASCQPGQEWVVHNSLH